ncbi:Pentatricopeptide repeat-containing protein [Artemisia annua]|uniref:Pentatricopeptide repeat-containing protein n=1 Tax=Artemisia annua TaxID=35608 RepID=A0A2U1LA95_ARTAN|nr:Pentatricopeptide repeat-containing protein [Artemisia annua]
MLTFRTKLTQTLFSLSKTPKFTSRTYKTLAQTLIHTQHVNPPKPSNLYINKSHFIPRTPFSSTPIFHNNSDSNSDSDDHIIELKDNENNDETLKKSELDFETGLIMDIIKYPHGENALNVKRNNLYKCNVAVTAELVSEVLARVRNDWEVAFMFFKWAGEQRGYAHSLRQYNCMIAILGKMGQFEKCWSLIDEMEKGGGNGLGESMVTSQTLLIMVRRYAAVHDVENAVKTFYGYERFGFKVGVDVFHDVLSALCRYKNVNEAEKFMFRNEKVFPLCTKSFNIVLNGWCNVVCSPREGKRVWLEMCNRGIHRDVVSYSSIISCYSKRCEVNEVIKVFNELLASDVSPDRKLYNSVIHALAKSGRVEKARDVMKSMEERGIRPNVVTYNSLIMPLCKKGNSVNARLVFDEMLQRGLLPTVKTYHAFFRVSRTSEEVFSIMQKMSKLGCCLTQDTYAMLIRKFCRWGEVENVWKLWDEMISNGLDPDRSSYVALVHGLFLNGMLDEAYKYHVEMKAKGLLPEPEIENRMEAWMTGMKDSKTKCGDS